MNDSKTPIYKKVLIGAFGGIVLLIGIVAIPYPGPGWLIVFAGLGILSTEFAWAEKMLAYAKSRYDKWQRWLRSQPTYIKVMVWSMTCVVVVATIWLLNGYGILSELLNIDWKWLRSPLVG